MGIEQTLVSITPNVVRDGFGRKIRQRYEEAGLEVLQVLYKCMNKKQAELFYDRYKRKHFFDGLVRAMSSGFSMFIILEGENVIRKVKNLNGSANSAKAKPGTIRHDFQSTEAPYEVVHASNSRR